MLYEVITVVCEGAGSPVELNLMDKDLSNIFIADEYNTKIILIADIEKGGVFASIYGVYNLLPKKLRENVIGVIINKFRGDLTLFDEGVRIIQEDFKIPVLGVLPYTPFNFGFEDSQSLKNYIQNKEKAIINVGVISVITSYSIHYTKLYDFLPYLKNCNKAFFDRKSRAISIAAILEGIKFTISSTLAENLPNLSYLSFLYPTIESNVFIAL